jgi:parvulin-like peptidyl-prolyl isomerase
MTRQERERSRAITIVVGVVVGLAIVALVGAVLWQSVVTPISSVAVVNGDRIVTRDLWKRAQYDHLQRESNLRNLLNYQQQIDPGGQQGFFTSQIQQLQSDLIDNEGLTNKVLEQMIEEDLIRQQAAKNGVTASDAEIQAKLEAVVAAQNSSVTAPDATATAEALAAATPTPTFTPSPTPTATLTSTVNLTPTATPLPTPTVSVQTGDEFTQRLDDLLGFISEGASVSKDDASRMLTSLITVDLLREKLLKQVGDQMPTSGERVRAQHILIAVPQDATPEVEQLALAKAISITQRLNNGEDFATLAQQFSDDTSSGAQGGELGFFGRGQMVKEFEDAAFSLPIGKISDPVKSQFGYHIIRVEEKDNGQPDITLWLQDLKASAQIKRSLTPGRLGTLPTVSPELLQSPVTAAPAAQPQVVGVTPAPIENTNPITP